MSMQKGSTSRQVQQKNDLVSRPSRSDNTDIHVSRCSNGRAITKFDLISSTQLCEKL